VRRFIAGLAVYERLDEKHQDLFHNELSRVPDRAVKRYQEDFRRLATECPEVAF
jgi:hypothetical protein